jgi:hypothetical protein
VRPGTDEGRDVAVVSMTIDAGRDGVAADLRAQVYDAADVGVGFEVADGFADAGGGRYVWSRDLPPGFAGSVAFYRASDRGTVFAVVAVGGGAAAYADARPSPW